MPTVLPTIQHALAAVGGLHAGILAHEAGHGAAGCGQVWPPGRTGTTTFLRSSKWSHLCPPGGPADDALQDHSGEGFKGPAAMAASGGALVTVAF
jgi:hypothetical protein